MEELVEDQKRRVAAYEAGNRPEAAANAAIMLKIFEDTLITAQRAFALRLRHSEDR